MRLHEHFEWDAGKAKQNQRKHRVSFDTAAEVLADDEADRFHLEEYDESHSDEEDRYLTTASHPANRDVVLVVSWTPRGPVTRIISARKATTAERMRYESEIT